MTWDETFRNVLQGIGAVSGFLTLALLFLLLRRMDVGGLMEGIFLSRRKRVERRFLVYRGKHYPRKSVKVRIQRLLPDIKHKVKR